jgi:VCBS repeat-containing protein
MTYFRELPDLEYQSFLSDRQRSNDYVRVKNLFRRGKLRDDISNVLTVFDKYQIPDGYRPDNVAEELYRSAEYDWVVLISAGITNVRDEWPLSDADLYNYAYQKYGEELYATHHYITKEVKDSGERIIMNEGKLVNNIIQLPYPSYYPEIGPEEIDIKTNMSQNLIYGNLFIHDDSTIIKTEDYGTFEIDNENNIWVYQIDLNSLQNLEFFDNEATVVDTLQYIAVDGYLKKITIETKVNEVNNELEIEFLTDSESINSTQVSYVTYYDSITTSYATSYNITTPVSNYEYEVELNNQKRGIYILKPFYLQQFVNDNRDIMRYKKSSQLTEDKDGNDIIRTENTRNTMPYGSTFTRESPSEVIRIDLA